MESLLRSHPTTSSSLKYIEEGQRALINPLCLDDATDLSARYGLSLTFHTVTAQRINCLYVTPFGRFGNLLMQIGHALDVANFFSIQRIYFDAKLQEPGVFQETRAVHIDGTELIAAEVGRPSVHDVILYGTFWSLHNLTPKAEPIRPRDVIPSRVLINLLADDLRDVKGRDESDAIFVHLRGGDIFQTNVQNTHYAQPPLAFYIEAIEKARGTSNTRVVIVFEDMANPVVADLFEWLSESGIPFDRQSGELKDDLKALLSAQTIVASFGTFVPAIMKLSRNIKCVYSFDNHEIYNAWFRFRRDVELIEYTDASMTYIQRGEWIGSDDQLAMMRSYPAERMIRLVR